MLVDFSRIDKNCDSKKTLDRMRVWPLTVSFLFHFPLFSDGLPSSMSPYIYMLWEFLFQTSFLKSVPQKTYNFPRNGCQIV